MSDCEITVYPDGPLVVRGDFTLRAGDGTAIETDRSALALCRCGRSRLKPLCDASHKGACFRADADAAGIQHVVDHAAPPPRD